MFNAGQYVELERLARLLVAQYSDSGFAWKVLGACLTVQRKEGLAALQKAANLLPEDAEAHGNLGTALRNLGRLDDAVASYFRALEIKPDYAEAHNNLGNALKDRGRLDEAVASYSRALEIKPDYAEAHNNLGNALKDIGRPDDAMASYSRALEIKPDYAEAHNSLGNALKDIGRPDDAVASYRRALGIKPDHADANNNLGATLKDRGQLDEAIMIYRRALVIKPDYSEAQCNLGNALKDRGRLDEAVVRYRRALLIEPDYAEAQCNLGNALKDIGQLDEAVLNYRRTLEIRPRFAEAHSNLLLCLNYDCQRSAAEVFAEHRRWDEKQTCTYAPIARLPSDRNPERRLRVGYISPDLRQHSVAYFLESLLREHDRKQVEVFCYADVLQPDAMSSQLQGLTDRWLRTAGLSDEALTQRIVGDNIDILVDLAGHTGKNRLLVFACKPAPVQVTWLGYPNTTGLRAIDYRLVDSVTDPEGDADDLASEVLVRLANGFLCYSAPVDAPPPSLPPCSTNGGITFGCFNNPSKLSSATLDAWAALLIRVPGARLLCKDRIFAHAGGGTNLLEQLVRRGVDIRRVTLRGFTAEPADHLALYGQVDIALDPFPYNGTTTTCEALWMGVPVVSLCGDRHAGRVGASLLNQIGLTELIADSTQSYVDIAAGLAGDIPRLGELRRTLRMRMKTSPLCDASAFARKVESAYRDMWQRWCGKASQVTLTLFNGVRIVVPDSLELMTPYVLQEQQDWFEDEIGFLRRLLQPGQSVIDIGANYGVYTLSLARTVGPTGRVWAFEPASTTASHLAEGIAANGFVQVVLERSALSNHQGTAELSLNGNSELNALAHGGPATTAKEWVPVVTLDGCLARHGWRVMDFMKIDAEGEESNILKGGRRFFTELSPLVQYEIRASAKVHMALVQDFSALGYDTYRLVPGLDLLVPFDADSPADGYLLNLFCCKSDRAKHLAAQGFLLESDGALPMAGEMSFNNAAGGGENLGAYDGEHRSVTQLPYGPQFGHLWNRPRAAGDGAEIDRALSLYVRSRDSSARPAERFRALENALGLFKAVCERQPSPLRLASLARIAQDFGARSVAVGALQQLIDSIQPDDRVDMNEPFLAPEKRFDAIPPGDAGSDWVLAAALEALERLEYFSSYFAGISARKRLERIDSLGFGGAEMKRRLYLVRKRFCLSVPQRDA
ncbi:MAG: tetratricopeptide repeat protein [Sterolibacterium sp.]